MLDTSNPYATFGRGDVVANAVESERTIFIRRTYAHLAIAIAAFVGLEAALIKAFPLETLAPYLTGRWTWLIVLGGFMAVSWVARMWADSSASKGLQYAGLSLYVIAEAVVFLPLMALATRIDPNIPLNAGLITLTVFMGLTVFVFATKADFSWLGRYLAIAGFAALGIMLCSVLFNLELGMGMWMSAAMVVLAAGYILYDTSNVMNHYRTNQYVAASLALFASVALMLWYVVRILMSMRED